MVLGYENHSRLRFLIFNKKQPYGRSLPRCGGDKPRHRRMVSTSAGLSIKTFRSPAVSVAWLYLTPALVRSQTALHIVFHLLLLCSNKGHQTTVVEGGDEEQRQSMYPGRRHAPRENHSGGRGTMRDLPRRLCPCRPISGYTRKRAGIPYRELPT